MSFTINLPDAGLLGISAATVNVITADTTGVVNGVYIGNSATAITITLPPGLIAANTLNAGDLIYIKNRGAGTLSISENTSQMIDGDTTNVDLAQNESAIMIYINDTDGWTRF